ncbi:class I SAM-dependent methyltransferase [Scleromatobacter humisilvae]|uniref:Class I SAM-dependent methyltransferase n=1 Tax=Scleromatobacter humisilvae TaxID=2897159 RepID=A0A9X2C2H4_9BURK|nr:class I SAM-dependent methyltransferase [Scleromatobacter humisilvae]MCK9689327.1 class I SAM-dependent methyltransferase [Scleromatobacter humisilvae]
MADERIRFDDGEAYEDFMGKWSLLAGHAFLDWLSPAPGLRWVDVGCGNGAFTELLVQRCAAREVQGIDPSDEQLAFARTRLARAPATFRQGDAMALPYADASVDAAVMALVIFFVPEPARGVAEMARVIRPGGGACAYAWDILGGGFPYFALQDEMKKLGHPPLWPPSVEAARLEALRQAWTDAGLVDVETRELVVQRTYASFDAFWAAARKGPRIAPRMSEMPASDAELLKTRLRKRLKAAADGSITTAARANAVRGRKPD